MQITWQEQEKNDILSALEEEAISLEERDFLLREVLEQCEMQDIDDATTREIKDMLCHS